MRVVDITGFFSSACGGIKTYYREKAARLPALGVECHFVVPGRHSGREPFGGGTLHRIAGPRMPVDHNYHLFGDWRGLEDAIAAIAPDVIEIASHAVLPWLVERALRRAARRPTLVGFYHADVPHAYVEPHVRFLPAPLRRRAIAGAWRWVRARHARYRRTLVASRRIAADLAARGVPGVTWVGLGVDVDAFRPEAGSPGAATVAYVGRLTGEKGFGVLLAAWDEIAHRTGAELVIAGAGPLERRIPVRPDVRFLGYVGDRAALARILASAAVVVVPGAYETFSLAAAEALACGSPVVCADRGAAAELVQESGAGRTFAAGDPRSLAAAIGDVIGRDRAAAGRAGRAHILASFTWPAVCRRILDAYASA